VQEYSDLTFYLYEQYGQTHKRFIITNWESDNDVYCGAAYAYATNPAAKALCDSNYPAAYGVRTPEDALAGLTLCFKARRQGIEEGRQRALALGLGGRGSILLRNSRL